MIYFIGGLASREFKYFEILNKLKEKNSVTNQIVFDIGLKEEEQFLEKVSINSIFSTYEIVVLKRSEKLKNIEKTLEYIMSLDITNKDIIIDYEKEDGKISEKLLKKLEKYKEEKKLKYELFLKENDGDIKKYIEKELLINEKEIEQLLEMIGKNPFKVKNEVDKIKSYLGDEKYDINKIKQIISIEKEYKIYEVVSKLFMNNVKEVFEYLDKTKEYMGVLYYLYGELEIMYKLNILLKEKKISTSYDAFKNKYSEKNDKGYSIEDLFRVNGKSQHYYGLFKKIEKAKKYKSENLKKLIYKCWECEKNIKTGKIEMDTAVELLIMEVVKYYNQK